MYFAFYPGGVKYLIAPGATWGEDETTPNPDGVEYEICSVSNALPVLNASRSKGDAHQLHVVSFVRDIVATQGHEMPAHDLGLGRLAALPMLVTYSSCVTPVHSVHPCFTRRTLAA